MNERVTLETFFTVGFRRDPNQVAVMDYDTKIQYTYLDLHDRVLKVAYFLKKELKLNSGARVALCARNGQWSLDLFYAMPLTGCILTTYNSMLKETELTGLIKKEAPSVIFYETFYASKMAVFKKAMPKIAFVALDDENENPLGDIVYAEILNQPQRRVEWEDIHLEDICMLIHTGGTTGQPKAAKISYRAVMYNTIGQVITYNITEHDVVYISFPFFHCASWNSALPILLCGGKIILKKKFCAETALDMMEKERLTFLAGSPTVFKRIAQTNLFESSDFSSVRGIRCGSATPPLELMKKYWNKGLLFYNGYGLTEAGPGMLSLPAGAMSRKLIVEKAGSAGKPMVFTKLKIVDQYGHEVAAGCEGELIIQSGTMFSGYWEADDTENTVKDGWIYTGDIARCDEDGYYFICGRKKNMYISGGENVYPMEIELKMHSHPALEDAHVFGVPDDDWGEVGKAIVVLKEGVFLSKEELIHYLTKELSAIKLPKYVQFVDEVPRNDAGKIVGKAVEERYKFPDDSTSRLSRHKICQ